MKQSPKLAQARSYWRLAQKARNAGNYRQADRYAAIAESKHREYERQKAFTDRLKQQREKDAAARAAKKEAQR